jgi:hypothetical protein
MDKRGGPWIPREPSSKKTEAKQAKKREAQSGDAKANPWTKREG